MNPNKREAASYYPDNLLPIRNSGKLTLVTHEVELFNNIHLRIFNGHTTGQLIPLINYNGHMLVFGGDFIPTVYNIPLPFVPDVDIQPLVTMDEKSAFLEEAVSKGYTFFFEHDYFNECCNVKMTEKGVAVDQCFPFNNFQNHIA